MNPALKARQMRHFYPEWLKPEVIDWTLELYTQVISQEVAIPLEPVTAMTVKNFERFVQDREYKTVWQTGPTWHTKFSKDVLAVREFNEKRLFGERAEKTVYAVGFSQRAEKLGLADTRDLLEKYMITYGDGEPMVLVRWKDHVLERATFCYGDCQQGCLVFPYHPKMVAALAFLLCAVWAQERREVGIYLPDDVEPEEFMIITKSLFCNPEVRLNPYFELQLHGGITTGDVKDAEYI